MRTTCAIVFILTLVWDTYAKPPQAPTPPQGPPVKTSTPTCGKENCDCGCKDGGTCTCAANTESPGDNQPSQWVSYRTYAPVYTRKSYVTPVYSYSTYSQPVYRYQTYSAPTYSPAYVQPTYSRPTYSAPTYSQPSYQSYAPARSYGGGGVRVSRGC